jgi:hypothetical protein
MTCEFASHEHVLVGARPVAAATWNPQTVAAFEYREQASKGKMMIDRGRCAFAVFDFLVDHR